MTKFIKQPPEKYENTDNSLTFRPFNNDDSDGLIRLATDPLTTRFVPWAKFVTDTRSAEYRIAEFNSSYDEELRVRYAVEKDGKLVGYAGIWPDGKSGYIEFGFAVLPKQRGKKIGSAILDTVRIIASAELQATGIIAYVHDGNNASKATVLRAGFKPSEEFDGEDRRYELMIMTNETTI